MKTKKEFSSRRFMAVALSLCLLFGAFALAGCSGGDVTTSLDAFQGAVPVGELPDEFKDIVAQNLFKDAVAFENRMLTAEAVTKDEENNIVEHCVRMMDIYGKELAAYTARSTAAYHVTTLTATEDGGFLFVLGFREYYSSNDNQWASANGFASRVVKCDKDGICQFDTALDGVEGSALCYCFEKNGRYYLFGTAQTPDSKTTGVHSPTDVYMASLDTRGSVLKSATIGGSDYDSLDAAEMSGEGFVLSVSAQSDDGDFVGSASGGYSVDWVVTVDHELETVKKEKKTGREYFDFRIGEKAGAAVYKSNPLFEDFDAGEPSAFVDYGVYYLIVSEHITGVYENTPPVISSIWYYTETVYSAYDESGKLLFRASVDSSPDYDAIVREFDQAQ